MVRLQSRLDMMKTLRLWYSSIGPLALTQWPIVPSGDDICFLQCTGITGMPKEMEVYYNDPDYAIINVPPLVMFNAKCFKPPRLCAVF